MRILVTPELLDDLSRQMAQAAAQLFGIGDRLGHALNAMDWEVRQKANVEGLVNAARSRAYCLADEADRLGRYLTKCAAAFREADAQGAQSLAAIAQTYYNALPALSGMSQLKVPDRRAVQRHTQLGILLSAGELITTTVPVVYLMSRATKSADGQLIIRGKQLLKDFVGLSSHLTHIQPHHLPRHWLRMEKGLSLSLGSNAASALDVGIPLIEALLNHAGQGFTAVVSATLVDSAISSGTRKLFSLSGAAIGAPLGPFGSLVGYTVGGAVGVFVSDWLCGTPHRQVLQDTVRQGLDRGLGAIGKAAQKFWRLVTGQ